MAVRLGSTGIVIVGAGPAGLAPLFAAASAGRLEELLRRGVTILERSQTVGSGALPQYSIESDSSADAFLDIVLGSKQPQLRELAVHPLTRQLIALGKQPAPLSLVAAFLALAGEVLCRVVASSPRGRVLTGTQASCVQQRQRADWCIHFVHLSSGIEYELEADAVVLATGAHQPEQRLLNESVAGQTLSRSHQAKLLQSGAVLSHGGVKTVAARLSKATRPRAVILGGSTSAGSVAAAMLAPDAELGFEPDGLLLMHRKPLRIFYETVEEALAEGYCEFSGKDICPITGRLYRLSGFRSVARELILATLGMGVRPPENRLRLFPLQAANEAEARRLLDEADLIIACFGYRPRLLPVLDRDGRALALCPPEAEVWSAVDPRCRVLTSARLPLEGLFALGLAVGPGASRELGGEADFRGQINSLWLWQHTLGARILDELLASGAHRSTKAELQSAAFLPAMAGSHSSEWRGVSLGLGEAR